MTGPLAEHPRTTLIRASAALAGRSGSALDQALRVLAERAIDEPETAVAIEEMLLQSYLFVGYPLALEGLRRWRAFWPRPAAPPTDDDWDAWVARGAEVCRSVYGGRYEELRANVRALHPDMERWMVTEGYGKVLGRPGLHLVDRELCIVAALGVLDMPRQLYSHLRGALRAGADERDVVFALEQTAYFSGAEAGRRARETWDSVRTRHAGGSDGVGAPAGVGESAEGDAP